MKFLRSIFIVASLILLSTACSSDSEEVIENSKKEEETTTLLAKYSKVLGEHYESNFSAETVGCLANFRLSRIEDPEELEERLDALTEISNEEDEYFLAFEEELYEASNDEVDCYSNDELMNYFDVYYAWPEGAANCLLDETGNHENLKDSIFFNPSDYKPELQECTPWVVEDLNL